jgi:uncharacterized repeat protein (TIGR01451 family)
MKKSILRPALLIFLSSFYIINAFAQPTIQWQNAMGGTNRDFGYSVIQTSDGGYITIGESRSVNVDVTGHHVGSGSNDDNDIWVVKTDAGGNIQWQKSYGGTAHDFSGAIIQTSDGGYMIAGSAASNDGDVTGNHGSFDAWIVKINATGVIQWQKCFGGTAIETAESIVQTADGGFIIGGSTTSNDGDVSGNHGGTDVWIIKTDALGVLQWQKCLGGSSTEARSGFSYIGLYNNKNISVSPTSDGGYAVLAESASNDGDVTGHHGTVGFPYMDVWLVKLNSVGSIQWQKSAGGTGTERAFSFCVTSDKGYLVAASTGSSDGDVTGFHGGYDEWIIKFDSSGTMKWQKCFGGTGTELALSISPTNDDGYVIGGIVASSNGDVAGNHGGQFDGWFTKIDSTGKLQWQKCLGGAGRDVATSIAQTADGGYIMSGHTNSVSGDVSGGSGDYDFWLVKFSGVPTNVITGTVYEDLNANCVKDIGEAGFSGKIIKAMPGNYYASTDANGNYSLFVDPGTYTVSHVLQQYYAQVCPVAPNTHTVSITTLIPNSYGNDFGDTLTSHCADLKLSVGAPFLRRCFKNGFYVQYSNNGAVAANNAIISLTFDNGIVPLSSSGLAWTKTGNVYNFNAGTLQPKQKGNFYITDSVSCALPLPSIQCINATIHTTTTECDSLNNSSNNCYTVVGSCDPNDKEIYTNDKGYVQQDTITAADTLTYMIRFQNVGTDTAFTVIVRDTLPLYLDPSTVELDIASHPYTFRLYGHGILEWTINTLLPDSTTDEVGSHGFVKFKIKQKPGNVAGTFIKNNAYIYFDYNQAVITGYATAVIPLITDINTFSKEEAGFTVYPNPANGIYQIRFSEEMSSKDCTVEVYNVYGQLVYKKQAQSLLNIDLSDQPNAAYLLKIKGRDFNLNKVLLKN